MDTLKVKSFNNFQDIQNVVTDGKRVTTAIEIEDSPVKPCDSGGNSAAKVDVRRLADMVSSGLPDYSLIRRFLMSMSFDLPELVSKVLTSGEAVRVVELMTSVTIKEELDNGEAEAEGPGVDDPGGRVSGIQISDVVSVPLPINVKDEMSMVNTAQRSNEIERAPGNCETLICSLIESCLQQDQLDPVAPYPRQGTCEDGGPQYPRQGTCEDGPSSSCSLTRTNDPQPGYSLDRYASIPNSISNLGSVIKPVAGVVGPVQLASIRAQLITSARELGPELDPLGCSRTETVIVPRLTENLGPIAEEDEISVVGERIRTDRGRSRKTEARNPTLAMDYSQLENRYFPTPSIRPGNSGSSQGHPLANDSSQDVIDNPWGLPLDLAEREQSLRTAIRECKDNNGAYEDLSFEYDRMLQDFACQSEDHFNHIKERYRMIMGGRDERTNFLPSHTSVLTRPPGSRLVSPTNRRDLVSPPGSRLVSATNRRDNEANTLGGHSSWSKLVNPTLSLHTVSTHPARDQVYSHQPPRDQVYSHQPPRDQVYSHQPPRDQVNSHQPPRDQVNSHQPPSDIINGQQPLRHIVNRQQPPCDIVYSQQPHRDQVYSQQQPLDLLYGQRTTAHSSGEPRRAYSFAASCSSYSISRVPPLGVELPKHSDHPPCHSLQLNQNIAHLREQLPRTSWLGPSEHRPGKSVGRTPSPHTERAQAVQEDMVIIHDKNLMQTANLSKEFLVEGSVKRRQMPTRAAASRAIKRTRQVIRSSSSDSSEDSFEKFEPENIKPEKTEPAKMNSEEMNSDVDQVKEQTITKRMKKTLRRKRKEQTEPSLKTERGRTPEDSDEEDDLPDILIKRKPSSSIGKKKQKADDIVEGGRTLRKRYYREELEFSSDDSSPEAQRHRALQLYKERRGSSTKKSRILNRPVKSDSEEEGEKPSSQVRRRIFGGAEDAANIKERKQKTEEETYWSSDGETRGLDGRRVQNRSRAGRRIVSESEESWSWSGSGSGSGSSGQESTDSDDSFVAKDYSVGDYYNRDEFEMIKEGLMRKNPRFQELNEDYEHSSNIKHHYMILHHESEDEHTENKYPPKLLESLRQAHEDLRLANPEAKLPEEDSLVDDEIINRWILYDFNDLAIVNGMKTEGGSYDGECVCSRTGLRYLYFMRMKNIKEWQFHTRIVGSECIKWFCKTNPNTSLAFIQRVVKDGCTILYRKHFTENLIQGSLCGTMLPDFLREHRSAHASEYIMPLKFAEDSQTIHIKMRMLFKGRPKDSNNKPLRKGKKYHVHLRPVLKPCKDPNVPHRIDFVITKMELQVDRQQPAAATNQEPSGKAFLK